MKRLAFLLLALVLVLPLSAWYSPSFTLECGINTLALDSNAYQSARTGLELGLVGIKIKSFTLSLPITVTHITRSTENNGLLVPSYFKVSIGAEGLIEGKRFGGSVALFFGYEDYTEANAVIKYVEGRIAAHYKLAQYFSLMIPLSYTYTPEGNEMSMSVALRIGGEIL